MPTASVIVPTYNRADALPRTIDSVLAQTFEDLELIVVDDASSDNTKNVVESYDDPRITFLSHETNQGGSAARNTGIEHATGEYIAFLDSDDEWLPQKLERQISTLESRADDWVAAYCGVITVSETPRHPLREFLGSLFSPQSTTEGPEGGEELIKEVLTDNLHTSAGSTLIVRRDIVEKIDGFDESFDRFQDPEFLIRVLEQGKLAYAGDELVKRYATGIPPADAIREADEHYLRTFSETVEELEAAGHDVHGAHEYYLAKCYLKEGRFRRGLSHLLLARRPSPRQLPGLFNDVVTGVRKKTS
ncbi:glycosyltransferase family 2 protein (plasmid) [Haloferacaceae archaeon DSL9]